jgi:signal transduction histidine kinase
MRIWIAAIVLATAMVFVMDVSVRLGITGWLPYFLVLFLTARLRFSGSTTIAAVVIVVLIGLAHFLKPEGDHEASMINRTLGILLVVIAAVFIESYKGYQREIERAYAEAHEANRAKSAFVAMVSHELRTPLTAILGFSDLIRSQAFGPVGVPRYAEYAQDIHTSGTHLLDLINNILDISKMEAGRLEIDPEWVDVKPMLESAVRVIQDRALKQAQRVTFEVPEPALTVWADRRALNQILLNLLSNAQKFTPDGGSIAVAAAARSEGVEISISDTGIGIPAEHIERVIRPFERVDNSYSRSTGGTGLGLPLIKGLMDLHGGTMAIDSEPGCGTQVQLTFPAPAPSAMAPNPT